MNNTEYPKAITLLETINENLKIQTQNMFKVKKKSKLSKDRHTSIRKRRLSINLKKLELNTIEL